ncbi:MAG: hypothetical protein QM533_01150 [Cytophagales bacterium]|nr:hypothetical protein [Cytophagales bacterium]
MIQPFDKGKFDKRFVDTYKPAIEAAGLTAYRVDADPGVSVPINAIEEGIKSASICLADITVDNPNVWYELGFAFASGKPVVMVCSEERTGKKYPFDIQHRAIISYQADSLSDFDNLKRKLTERLKALVEKGETLRHIAEADPVASVKGLTQPEIMGLALIAGGGLTMKDAVGVWSVKQDAERAGLTNLGFNLAVHRLNSKKYVEFCEVEDFNREAYEAIRVTAAGWSWIDANESQFLLHRRPTKDKGAFTFDDDIPF